MSATIKWGNFWSQFSFFTGDKKTESADKRWRAFWVRNFGSQVFSEDTAARQAWHVAYITGIDARTWKQADDMDDAIEEIERLPPTSLYMDFLADEAKAVPSEALDYFVETFAADPAICPVNLDIHTLTTEIADLHLLIAEKTKERKEKTAAYYEAKNDDEKEKLQKEVNDAIAARESAAAEITTKEKKLAIYKRSVEVHKIDIRDYLLNQVKGLEVSTTQIDPTDIDPTDIEFLEKEKTIFSHIKEYIPYTIEPDTLTTAIDKYKHHHPQNIYKKRFLTEVLDEHEKQKRSKVPDINFQTFRSANLNYLVNRLSNDPRFNPDIDKIKTLRKELSTLPEEEKQTRSARLLESELRQLENKSPAVAIRQYLLLRAQRELKRDSELPRYAAPGTSYAQYQSLLKHGERPLPIPTWTSIVGWRLLNPLYWVDAIGGGICNLVARGICGTINYIFGNYKNSWPALGLKGLFAGVFILGNMMTSALATFFRVSAWSEPTRIHTAPILVRAATPHTQQGIELTDLKRMNTGDLNNSPHHQLRRAESYRASTSKAAAPAPLVRVKTIRSARGGAVPLSHMRNISAMHGSVVHSTAPTTTTSTAADHDNDVSLIREDQQQPSPPQHSKRN